MQKKLNDLQLVLMPCSSQIPLECREYYSEVYKLWHNVWSKTLDELDGLKHLYSNEFTRHHFLSAIFCGPLAVSLICYSEVDMSLEVGPNDIWFSSWPKDLLNEQAKRQGLGLIAAWYCTNPQFRKSNVELNFNISQVIIEIYGKIVLDGNYSAGYGTTRNNRSVGKYSANAGSVVAGKSMAHNCEVDLVIYEPEIIKEKEKAYSLEAKELWKNRIDFRSGYNERLRKAA